MDGAECKGLILCNLGNARSLGGKVEYITMGWVLWNPHNKAKRKQASTRVPGQGSSGSGKKKGGERGEGGRGESRGRSTQIKKPTGTTGSVRPNLSLELRNVTLGPLFVLCFVFQMPAHLVVYEYNLGSLIWYSSCISLPSFPTSIHSFATPPSFHTFTDTFIDKDLSNETASVKSADINTSLAFRPPSIIPPPSRVFWRKKKRSLDDYHRRSPILISSPAKTVDWKVKIALLSSRRRHST